VKKVNPAGLYLSVSSPTPSQATKCGHTLLYVLKLYHVLIINIALVNFAPERIVWLKVADNEDNFQSVEVAPPIVKVDKRLGHFQGSGQRKQVLEKFSINY
jgi:hypothetical protein